jgi:hypothetical protein
MLVGRHRRTRLIMRGLLLFPILFLRTTSVPAAEDPVLCETNALKEYNQANSVLLLRSELLMTVKTSIEQRRLQEEYCRRKCLGQCMNILAKMAIWKARTKPIIHLMTRRSPLTAATSSISLA